MLLLRLKFCPKWQPCFLAISNRPPSLVVRKIREMDKAEQRALWRERLTNQWLLCYSFKTNYKFRLFRVAFRARKLRWKMPKRNFPFDGTSPLQLKTHINAFYFEKLNDMDKIYGKFGPWQCRLRNFIKSVEVILILVFFIFYVWNISFSC